MPPTSWITLRPPGVPANLAGFKMFVQSLRTAFPDVHYHIDAEIAEGDMVTHRLTAHGTMKVELNSTRRRASTPAGRRCTWAGSLTARLSNTGASWTRWA